MPKKELSFFGRRNTGTVACAIQKRPATDVLFGRFGRLIDSWFYDRENDHYFCLIAKTDSTKKSVPKDKIPMRGAVFVVPKYVWKKSGISTKNLKGRIRNDNDKFDVANNLRKKLAELCKAKKCDLVYVIIERSGALKLAICENVDEEVQNTIIEQTYYFLRDIGHTHQHHEDDAEHIISVYPKEDDSGRRWEERVLFALYRWVINQKRAKSYQGYEQALGILAYAEVFRHIFFKTVNDEHDSDTSESKEPNSDKTDNDKSNSNKTDSDKIYNETINRFNPVALADSLKASANEKAIQYNYLQRLFAFASVYISTGIIPLNLLAYRIKVQKIAEGSFDHTVGTYITKYYEHPFTYGLFYLVFLLIIFGSCFCFNPIRKRRFMRDIARLNINFPKTVTFLFGLAVSIVATGGMIYITSLLLTTTP